MITNDLFDIPVLFIIFKRLDTTKQVLAVLQKIKPAQLFIAADGPRNNITNEQEKCNNVRNYVINNINWDCKIETLFRNNNVGCGRNLFEAITWFFKNIEMGIILEDDCIPSLSFFSYCKELLIKYENNNRIFHIAGNNPLTKNKSPFNASYYFTRIQHCWGWASWRRAWKYYSYDINDLDIFIQNKIINKIFKQNYVQNYWFNIFRKMQNHEVDAWDYQWTYAIFKENGLCINPSMNLVTNIGFSNEATHTFDTNSIYNNQLRYDLETIHHPHKIKINNSLINKINNIAFGLNKFYYLKLIIPKFLKRIIRYFI